MNGQPLVQERIVGRHQLHDIAIAAEHAVDEQRSSSRKFSRRSLMRDECGNRFGRFYVSQLAQAQPLEREIRRQRLRTRVRQHARTCLASIAASLSPPAARPPQLIVGQAAPEEERKPGSELQIRDATRARRAPAGASSAR